MTAEDRNKELLYRLEFSREQQKWHHALVHRGGENTHGWITVHPGPLHGFMLSLFHLFIEAAYPHKKFTNNEAKDVWDRFAVYYLRTQGNLDFYYRKHVSWGCVLPDDLIAQLDLEEIESEVELIDEIRDVLNNTALVNLKNKKI